MPATQREITCSITHDPVAKQQAFEKALAGFRKHGTLTRAAKVAEVDTRTLKEWLYRDPLMQKMFQEIDEEVTDGLEEAAIKRAKKGSDTLMIHMLSSRRERYKHKGEVTIVQTLNLENVMEKMRQIALSQPTLAPMIRSALESCLEKLP